jgi:3-deoxy-D-manno-octulosonate 8-phosphate phosphatase (KDO 8-P phosphatase)
VIDAVFMDIDGVLTDGAVYVDAHGNETKKILFDDIDAIFELKRSGMKIGFITGEDTEFCKYVQRRFEPDFFFAGCKDKLAVFKNLISETGLDKKRVCYVGDSRKDIELLQFVEYSFVPSDVELKVKESSKNVLQTPRGKGVIKEVAAQILNLDNRLSSS